MQTTPDPIALELNPGAFLDMDCAKGAVVTCVVGQLWITRAGCPQDFVLSAGARYLVARDGRISMHALQFSVGLLEPVAQQAPTHPARWTLPTRIGEKSLCTDSSALLKLS